jgi:hypothetical protein
MGVVLKGSTVSVALNGNVVLGFAYNAALADGGVGLLARGGAASFDTVTLKTNDAAVASQTVLLSAGTVQVTAAAEPLIKTMAAAPEQDYAVNSMLASAGLASTGPNIDWSNLYAEPVQALATPVAASSKAQEWQADFVNQLALSEAERNPNANLRVQVAVAPKLKAELNTLHSHV